MSNLEEQILYNGFCVTVAMTDLENAKSLEEYNELADVFDERVKIWRGSIICRLLHERCVGSNE